MSTFHGTVVGGRIQLDGEAHLPEGSRVTILVQDAPPLVDPEDAFDQELVEQGLLAPACANPPRNDFLSYQPVPFQGDPLSKTIVEERR